MKLTNELIKKGFALREATDADLPAWLESKKVCYKDYVDQYYGGWEDGMQAKLNTATFEKSRRMSCFRVIEQRGEIVGFFGFDEQPEQVVGLTIHMFPQGRNQGLGSFFLEQVRTLGKPAALKVFKTNPARRLYERHGFKVYDETESHYLMKLQTP